MLLILQIATLAMIGVFGVPASDATDAPLSRSETAEGKIRIEHIAPDPRGGKAYKLVYVVPVPVETHWAFKTDFDNNFLVENKYILEHRFESHTGKTVVTKNKYTNGPDVFFQWQTTIIADTHRLEFVLTNPEECGQAFHYGYIQLEGVEEGTQVTQVAYFDFRGVTIWAAYPWAGGMREFLAYTAKWEQDIIERLKHRYSKIKKK